MAVLGQWEMPCDGRLLGVYILIGCWRTLQDTLMQETADGQHMGIVHAGVVSGLLDDAIDVFILAEDILSDYDEAGNRREGDLDRRQDAQAVLYEAAKVLAATDLAKLKADGIVTSLSDGESFLFIADSPRPFQPGFTQWPQVPLCSLLEAEG